ncbi:hypothetical protein, partial [Hymenobacter negativus]|uniref:hypothetical protein n=1 Tax=Hymenobacter negativus TaxID=2795026 RepID=UPI001BB44581
PFVATLVDVTGLIIYFSVALLILRGTLPQRNEKAPRPCGRGAFSFRQLYADNASWRVWAAVMALMRMATCLRFLVK